METLLWYSVPQWQTSVHCSAKAGSQTLLAAILNEFGIEDPGMGNRRRVVHRELVDQDAVFATTRPVYQHRAIQFVRHPRERFESLCRNKIRDKGDNVPEICWEMSPNHLLLYIWEHTYDNVHWCPQSVATPHANYIYRLEEIAEHIPTVGVKNQSMGDEVLEYDMSLLEDIYYIDHLLYEGTA